MVADSKNLGDEGFVWFIGIVTDVDDEDMLGYVQVYIPAIHDSPTSKDLPWAAPIMPITSASYGGVGISPTGIKKGSMVVGFYMDGKNKNIPVIFGTLPKINDGDINLHDVHLNARETNTTIRKMLGNEPKTQYAAKYPYNKTITTESGHIIELDDTPKAERINITHKTGSYVEMNPDGSVVSKSDGDSFVVVGKNDSIYINGNCTIKINGNCKVDVGGDYIINAKKIKLTAEKIELN